jgi:hypothetical protein
MVGREVQHGLAGVAGEPAREPEQPVAQPFRLPASRRVVGEGEHLGPGDQVEGERDNGAPDLVLGEVVQGQVGQAGVLRAADAVLAAGAAAVA